DGGTRLRDRRARARAAPGAARRRTDIDRRDARRRRRAERESHDPHARRPHRERRAHRGRSYTAMIIVVLVSCPFLYVLARRPVLRRLALRNAVRRPRETLLVVLGSLLGTAIMTGSFVIGDTFDASVRRGAYEQLGPIDEVVSSNGIAAGAPLRASLGAFHDGNVDGVLPLTLTRAAIAADGFAAPKAQLLETDFDAARHFGGDSHASGISGTTPRPGEAVIGHDLAHSLHIGTGSTIDAF